MSYVHFKCREKNHAHPGLTHERAVSTNESIVSVREAYFDGILLLVRVAKTKIGAPTTMVDTPSYYPNCSFRNAKSVV